MRKSTLEELLKELSQKDLEEISYKFKVNSLNTHEIAEYIITNIENVLLNYNKREIEFLYEILANESNEIEADIEMNIFICDGLLGISKKENKDMFYMTEDLIKSISNISKEEILNKASEYDELESIIIGIVKTYGIIEIEDIFNIYRSLKLLEISYDNFEHFIISRTTIFDNVNLFNHHDEKFLYVDEIDDPDELVHELHHVDESYYIYDAKTYIINSQKQYICDEEKLQNLKDVIKTYLTDEYKYTDLIDTIMYDIKIDNYEDLMIDVTTYVEIATNDEHDEIKKVLDDLYNSTIKWITKGRM